MIRATLRSHGPRIARFGFVGVLCTVTDFGLFAAIVALAPIPPAAANVVSFLVANVEGYFLNALVTFRRGHVRPALSLGGYGRYLGAYAATLALSTVMVGLLSPQIGPLAAKGLAIACGSVLNYIVSALFVFRLPEGEESEQPESQ